MKMAAAIRLLPSVSVVLDDEIKQVGGLLLNAKIHILSIKGLVDSAKGALEPLVLFLAEEAAEIVFH